MRVQDMFGGLGRDMCTVCGQTPCNCTHVSESLRTENPCWKGYHPVGTKKKNGRTVPNCVPNANEAANAAQQAAIAIAKKKKAGVAESNDPQSRKLGRIIGRIYNEIYDMGDDALDYLNDRAPVWAELWDRYEGDIDSIITEEDPVTLGRAALELKDILNDLQSDQGVTEGFFGIDDKIKGKIQNIVSRLSDEYGMWDHKAQTFTPDGLEHLKSILKFNDKYIKYALSLTSRDFEAEGVAEGSEQIYNILALDKGNALKKPTKLKWKASSLEDIFDALAAQDWYPLEINGVEVIAGKRLKQGVAEGLKGTGNPGMPTPYDQGRDDAKKGRAYDNPYDQPGEEQEHSQYKKGYEQGKKQGVAEGWDPDTTRLEQDVRDALENGDDYTAKQYAKMAPTPEAKKYLLNIIKQAMYIDDLGGETDWKGVAEGEKNPHTSALGKALYRDLSKEKKASPAQVERNKERWAKRQKAKAERPPTKGMSNAEKVDKGWRNPNIDEGGEKWIKLPNGNYRNMHTGVTASTSPESKPVKPAVSHMYKVGWNDGVEDEYNDQHSDDPQYDAGFYAGLEHAMGPKGLGRSNPRRYNLDQGVAEEAENKDMTGQTCEKCKRGKYQERSQHDDMQGKVTCKCGHRVDRWKKYKESGVAEGAEFGAYYYEQLAQQVFDTNPDLTDENEILNLGYKIAKGELGSRAQGIFRDEDFPSDFVSSYGYLKKQGVNEVSDETLTSYLTKVDADSQKHEKDPTKRSAAKRNKSVAGFSRAFNKLDARKEKANENEGDPEGLPHLTPKLASHIAQQAKTQGPKAIVKSLEWGDGAAKELLDVFVRELDDIAKGQSNEEVSMNQDDEQLDELNFFKTAPAAPKKFVSRVGTVPGQQDLTYRKKGETFTLHQDGESFQLISNGQVVQTFNAPERDVQAHLAKEGYFLVKAPMTPTKSSSLGGPNWFKEGEEDEADYDNEYQNMVKRMAKKASDQERERGPVDINALAHKLRAISQKDQD
jgi:hypothetical protein